MLPPSPSVSLAIILVSDGAPASSLADALTKLSGIPAKPKLFAGPAGQGAFGWHPVAPHGAGAAAHCTNALTRAAMQKLPLVDAFFLVSLDGREIADACISGGAIGNIPLWRRMADTYAAARLKLGRIVVPTRGGRPLWPWLIDIGFRQPFVELGDTSSFDDVLAANRTQVSEIVLP
jgi:hypothetical protein